MLKVFCDKCGKESIYNDDGTFEYLQIEYPNKQICSDCDLEIKILTHCYKKDLINNSEPGTTLKKWLSRYQ